MDRFLAHIASDESVVTALEEGAKKIADLAKDHKGQFGPGASSAVIEQASHQAQVIGQGLRPRVVCEDGETARGLDLVRKLGSDLAQGCRLDRPLPTRSLAARWPGRDEVQAAVA